MRQGRKPGWVGDRQIPPYLAIRALWPLVFSPVKWDDGVSIPQVVTQREREDKVFHTVPAQSEHVISN